MVLMCQVTPESVITLTRCHCTGCITAKEASRSIDVKLPALPHILTKGVISKAWKMFEYPLHLWRVWTFPPPLELLRLTCRWAPASATTLRLVWIWTVDKSDLKALGSSSVCSCCILCCFPRWLWSIASIFIHLNCVFFVFSYTQGSACVSYMFGCIHRARF